MKLFLLMTVFLVATVTAISFQNTSLFTMTMRMQIQDNALDSARKAASSIENVFDIWLSLLNLTNKNLSLAASQKEVLLNSLLQSHGDIYGIVMIPNSKSQNTDIYTRFRMEDSEGRFEKISPQDTAARVRSWLSKSVSTLNSKDDQFVWNLSERIGAPLIAIGKKTGTPTGIAQDWNIIIVWSARIASFMEASRDTKMFLVNRDGSLFMTENPRDTRGTIKPEESPIVKNSLQSENPFLASSFVRKNGSFTGAFQKLEKYGLTLILERNTQADFTSLRWKIFKTALFGWLLLLIVMLVSYYMAGRVTRELLRLTETTLQIAQGNIGLRFRPGSRDEIGILGLAVDHMSVKLRQLVDYSKEAARLEGEIQTAKVVQATFIPQAALRSEGLFIKGFYKSASECGGDLWMHSDLGAGTEYIIIADATGHGAAAALVVALAYASFSALVLTPEESLSARKSPADILANMNRVFWNAGKGTTTMTLFLLQLDSKAKSFSYANAGHNSPFMVFSPSETENSTKKSKSLVGGGTPLGYSEDSTYTETTVPYKAGDKLFLFTDGLVECTNAKGEMILKKKLIQFVEQMRNASPVDICDKSVGMALNHFGDTPLNDDVTIVVAELL